MNEPHRSSAAVEIADVVSALSEQTNNEAACSIPFQSCVHQLDPALRQIAAPDAALVVETAK